MIGKASEVELVGFRVADRQIESPGVYLYKRGAITTLR